jgi:hypothetical protein
MRVRHPLAPVRRLVAAAVVAAVLVGGASPAHAVDWTKVSLRRYGACPSTDGGLYFNPRGRVYMYEYGSSGVIRFEAKYRLYRTEVTAGWNPARLTRTYSSSYFTNDATSYGILLPHDGIHQWTQVFGTSTYRLDVKAKWDRGWRRDWTATRTLAFCT